MTQTTGSAAVPAGNDQAFAVETHGIDIIPDEERHGSPRDLAWVWAAGVMVFTGLIIGGIVATLGLPLWSSLLAVVTGNLFFLLVGFIGATGPKAGTVTIVISRAAFGKRGNVVPTVLSWLTVLGWETVNAVVGTLALAALFQKIGLGHGTLQKAIALLIVILVTMSIAVWGHATIVVVQRWATYLLVIGLVITMAYGVSHIDWSYGGGQLAGSTSLATWLLAFAIVSSGCSISYLNMPADYSRYLSRGTSKRSITLYTALGGYVPATILMAFGVLLGTTIDMTNPTTSLQAFLPSWFLVPFLAVIVLGVITNNFLNTYSSGMNLLALGVKIERSKSVFVDGVVVGLLSIYAVFVSNFIDSFESFLSLMVIWICPWGGVFTVDFILRRYRYRSETLVDDESGTRVGRGVNVAAVIAFLVGAAASAACTNSSKWASPLMTGPAGGADLSVPAGLIVSALVYYVLARRQLVGAGSAAIPAAAAAPAPAPAPIASESRVEA